MRECSKCGKAKPVSEYQPCAGYRDGLRRWCNQCFASYKARWRRRGGMKRENATPAARARKQRYKYRVALKQLGLIGS